MLISPKHATKLQQVFMSLVCQKKQVLRLNVQVAFLHFCGPTTYLNMSLCRLVQHNDVALFGPLRHPWSTHVDTQPKRTTNEPPAQAIASEATTKPYKTARTRVTRFQTDEQFGIQAAMQKKPPAAMATITVTSTAPAAGSARGGRVSVPGDRWMKVPKGVKCRRSQRGSKAERGVKRSRKVPNHSSFHELRAVRLMLHNWNTKTQKQVQWRQNGSMAWSTVMVTSLVRIIKSFYFLPVKLP